MNYPNKTQKLKYLTLLLPCIYDIVYMDAIVMRYIIFCTYSFTSKYIVVTSSYTGYTRIYYIRQL